MKLKISAYALIRALGITTKKIIYSTNRRLMIKNFNKITNPKVDVTLINLSEQILEKKTNIMSNKPIKLLGNTKIKYLKPKSILKMISKI